jgi:hypothetical protein
MNANFRKSIVTIAAAFALSGTSSAISSTITFEDTEFSLSNYSITKSVTNQNVAIDTLATGGNPGAALRLVIDSKAGSSTSYHAFLEKSFIYDPSVSGEIYSIEYSLDKKVTSTFAIGTLGATMLIKQGDAIYSFGVSLPTTQGTFHTGSATNLKSANFSLFQGPTSGSTLHPNFTSGPLQFGFVVGWNPNGIGSTSILVDNFHVSITSVPEADSLSLAISGGLFLIFIRKSSSKFYRAKSNDSSAPDA